MKDELLLPPEELEAITDKIRAKVDVPLNPLEQLAKATPIIYQEGWDAGYQKGQQRSIGTDAKLVKEAKRGERERIISILEDWEFASKMLGYCNFIIPESDWQALKGEEK